MSKKLRCGVTTGSCAAAAAGAAAQYLLEGSQPAVVQVHTPSGRDLWLEPEQYGRGPDWAQAAVRKDAGDDPDVTDGVLVFARVEYSATPGITIRGGKGVGRVTRSGMDQPVGEAAINSVPRQMVAQQVEVVQKRVGHVGGLTVTISIPQGEELAVRTYNPRLGIVGGISVLGTTGIVHPMSEQALIDTIAVELRMKRATGQKILLLTPGNYGETYWQQELCISSGEAVQCSNFIGEALDLAKELGFSGVLLAGHLGKLVKLAGGMFQTHSKYGDCRMELLAAHAALCGANQDTIQAIMQAVMVDDALGQLKDANLLQSTMGSVMQAMEKQIGLRMGDFPVGVCTFTTKWGTLGMTSQWEALMQAYETEKERQHGER